MVYRGGNPCIFYVHWLVSFTHPCYRSRENLFPIAPLYHLRAIDLCHLRVLVTDRVNTCNTYARLVSYPRTCCSSKQQQSVHNTAQYRITAHFKAKVCTPLNATISMEYITLRFVMTGSPCILFKSAPFSVYSILPNCHVPTWPTAQSNGQYLGHILMDIYGTVHYLSPGDFACADKPS